MKAKEVFDTYKDYIMPTYKRLPVIFVKGKGIKLWDIHGKSYIDFFPGWGVSNLGHCHPKVMAAVRDQIKKLIHLPNNYFNMPQARLAKEIVYWSFDAKVFFCNSGAEAVEGAIKLARAFGEGKRYEMITFSNSFHGRTLAALSATGQEKYKEGFYPLPEGFNIIPFNDIDALRRAINDKTVAVMLELIQGEGGINVANENFVRILRNICDEKNLLLIFDEVQTGMGRTAKMFCYQHYGVNPDILVLAKALGGGLPIGAIVAERRIADSLKAGMHASTFGGSPLVCKAALAVFKAIQNEKLLNNSKKMADYLFAQLESLAKRYSFIKEIRGKGLMIGIELEHEGKPIVEEALKQGLLINCTQDKVLRLMPPLIVTKKDIDKAIKILDRVFTQVLNKMKTQLTEKMT